MEELPALQQRCRDESERSEVMAERAKQLEATLEEEKEQGQEKMAEMESLHQQQQKVKAGIHSLLALLSSSPTFCCCGVVA